MIDFDCGTCGRKIKVKDEYAGKRGKCPQCKAVVEVPVPAPVPEADGLPDFDAIAALAEREAIEPAPSAPLPVPAKPASGSLSMLERLRNLRQSSKDWSDGRWVLVALAAVACLAIIVGVPTALALTIGADKTFLLLFGTPVAIILLLVWYKSRPAPSERSADSGEPRLRLGRIFGAVALVIVLVPVLVIVFAKLQGKGSNDGESRGDEIWRHQEARAIEPTSTPEPTVRQPEETPKPQTTEPKPVETAPPQAPVAPPVPAVATLQGSAWVTRGGGDSIILRGLNVYLLRTELDPQQAAGFQTEAKTICKRVRDLAASMKPHDPKGAETYNRVINFSDTYLLKLADPQVGRQVITVLKAVRQAEIDFSNISVLEHDCHIGENAVTNKMLSTVTLASTKTNADGKYAFVNIPPGNYLVYAFYDNNFSVVEWASPLDVSGAGAFEFNFENGNALYVHNK